MGEGTVLLRRSSLGDVVLLGAVTGAVPGPVVIATDPAWMPVARRLVGVDQVVSWPRDADPGEVAAALPAGRWIDLQGSLRSWALCRAAGVRPSRLRKRSLRRRLRLRWQWVPPRPSVASIYAEACGVLPAPLPWIRLEPAPSDTLVLVPGARWPTKRGHPGDLIAVGRGWDGPVAVIGGPGDELLCAEVGAGIPGATVATERGFAATFEILARAAIAVGPDTGLLHLAGACGVPVVPIFTCTDPVDGFFEYPGEAVFREDLACRPCTLHGRDSCPLGTLDCQDVPIARIIEAVERNRR